MMKRELAGLEPSGAVQPPLGRRVPGMMVPWKDTYKMGQSIMLNGDSGHWAFTARDISSPAPPDHEPPVSGPQKLYCVTSSELHEETTKAAASTEITYQGFASVSVDVSVAFLHAKSLSTDSVHCVSQGTRLSQVQHVPNKELTLSEKALNMPNAKAFYAKYGYWYISGLQYGCCYTATYSAYGRQSTDQTELKVKVQAAVDSASVHVKGSSEFEQARKDVEALAVTRCDQNIQGFDFKGISEVHDLLDLHNQFTTIQPNGVPVRAELTPFNMHPDWPDAWEDSDVFTVADSVNKRVWEELAALEDIDGTLRASLARLQQPYVGPRQLDGNNWAYFTPLSKQQGMKALQALQADLDPVLTLFRGINLLTTPVLNSVIPDDWNSSVDDFTTVTLFEYVIQKQKQPQWSRLFRAQEFQQRLKEAGNGGLPMSKPIGNWGVGNSSMVDTCSAVYNQELAEDTFSKLTAIEWRGYYSLYGMSSIHGLPNKAGNSVSYIGSSMVGTTGGPGGGKFEPWKFNLDEEEHIIGARLQIGRAEAGNTDDDLILSLLFATDKNNRVGANGTGDSRGRYESYNAPEGHCLHGYVATGAMSVYGMHLVWIPKAWVPKVKAQ